MSSRTAIKVLGRNVIEPAKPEMVLRHANRDGRRDERPGGFADPSRDHLGADRIGADQAGWPVLLGRADRQDDPPAGVKISLDLLPGLQLKLHSPSFRAG